MNLGMIGGIIGSIIGILGGLIGTYFSIINTNGPKEKAFMVKCAIFMWISIIVFLVLLFSLPKPYSFLLFIPYFVALPIAILYVNRKQQKIRAKEKQPG